MTVELYTVLESLRSLFACIGLAVTLLLGIGLLRNTWQFAIALDQLVLTIVIKGGMADETISAWAHRRQHKRTERFINWVFDDDWHCARAYVSEMNRTQAPEEYR